MINKNLLRRITITVLALVTTSIFINSSVSASTVLPDGAKPVQKSGIIFGGTNNDVTTGSIVTNKFGQTAFCNSSYKLDGDFAGITNHDYSINGIRYPNHLLTIIKPDGTRQSSTQLANVDQFNRCYNVATDDNGDFYAVGILLLPQQAPMIFGSDTAKGDADGYVAKISKDTGNILWYKVFGGTKLDSVGNLTINNDGDLVILGSTAGGINGTTFVDESKNGGQDLFLAKLNPTNGEYIKNPVVLGGSGDDFEPASRLNHGLVEDKDGNLYVDFRTKSPRSGDILRPNKGKFDVGIFKLDKNFNIIKYASYGGSEDDLTSGFIQTSNGNLIMSVNTSSTDLPNGLSTTLTGKNLTFVEYDLDLNYKNGMITGGSGSDELVGYQQGPSGDFVIAGFTDSRNGIFADRTATTPTGYIMYFDPITFEIKEKLYYGEILEGIIFPEKTGDFYLIGRTTSLTNMGTITGTLKGMHDLFVSKFGPTQTFPAFIVAKDHGYISINGSGDVNSALNASIADYDTFVAQSSLVVSPKTVSTKEKKSFKITLSGLDAPVKNSYVHITANPDPLVTGKQLIDSASNLTVLAGSNLTSEKIITMANISAWNIDTQEKYTITVDATDLAAVNAVTTTTTTVPVKVTIPTVTRATVTKTTQVKVMTKEALVQEIKTEAEAIWGGDQSQFANTAVQAVEVGTKTPNEILNTLATTTKSAEEAVADVKSALVNIDTNGDGIADINIDTNNDGIADTNIDTNNDGIADINIDTNGDKKADLNIDTNGDGIADINIDKNNDGKPDVNIDINGDKVADVNKDTNNDGTADTNLVQSSDPAGLNYDKNGDNTPDLNIDFNGDGTSDLNIDIDGDKTADLNVDTNKDGKADLNIDSDKDGKADLNIDTNKDGKADLNVDIDGDGIADLNIDTNGDGKADKNIDADGDGKVDPIIIPGILPGVLPTTGTAIVGTIALIIALSTFFFRKYYISVK